MTKTEWKWRCVKFLSTHEIIFLLQAMEDKMDFDSYRIVTSIALIGNYSCLWNRG